MERVGNRPTLARQLATQRRSTPPAPEGQERPGRGPPGCGALRCPALPGAAARGWGRRVGCWAGCRADAERAPRSRWGAGLRGCQGCNLVDVVEEPAGAAARRRWPGLGHQQVGSIPRGSKGGAAGRAVLRPRESCTRTAGGDASPTTTRPAPGRSAGRRRGGSSTALISHV